MAQKDDSKLEELQIKQPQGAPFLSLISFDLPIFPLHLIIFTNTVIKKVRNMHQRYTDWNSELFLQGSLRIHPVIVKGHVSVPDLLQTAERMHQTERDTIWTFVY